MDNGAEFVSSTVQKSLKGQGINIHTTHNRDIQGAVIDCFNKSLKKRLYKHFTKNNTYSYLDVINKF